MEKNISPKCHDPVARSLCGSPAPWLLLLSGHVEVPPLFLCCIDDTADHLDKS